MSISIKYIHDMVFFVIDKTHHKVQRRSDIDLAAYEASLLVFNEYKAQYELTSTIGEYMSVFEQIKEYETPGGYSKPGGSPSQPDDIWIDSGFEKPDFYNRYTKITTDGGKPVDVVQTAQWDKRANHPIKVPSADYPIARIGNDKIFVLPKEVIIHLYYFKNPQEPHYIENQSGDYDPAASTGLEWSMDLWPKIGNLILGKLGINLGEQKIIEYSELQKR